MDSEQIALSTMQVARQLGQRQRPFQSHDVRERLKFGEQSPEAHYMHNVLGRLKAAGIIETTGPSRRRNQFLMVVDDNALRQRIDRARNGGRPRANGEAKPAVPLPVPETPKRVVYLEDRVTSLEAQIASLDSSAINDIKDRMDALDHKMDALDQKVDALVAMWS